jgi:hypothetical protein
MRQLRQIGKQLNAAPDGQVSLTDPDARSMATSGRGTGIVGYNAQTAVDTKHHLIVAHDVTNDGHDRDQLKSMCGQARDAIGTTTLTAFADRGYFKGEEILECERAGIKTMVPKPQTSGNKAAGLFDKADFRYLSSKDEYRCPAGERAIWRFARPQEARSASIYQYQKLGHSPLQFPSPYWSSYRRAPRAIECRPQSEAALRATHGRRPRPRFRASVLEKRESSATSTSPRSSDCHSTCT